ncbi:hypothetical protein [Falsiroseomonas sp. E2-1-a20]|uniref:hypothetical protein n=1 Tax=Falsiroseomonas sp. E2-1-a20 TaxID=3239300 RepID=UPI003F3FD530
MNATRRDVLRMASGLAAATVASSILTFEAPAASGPVDRDRLPAFMTGHFTPVMDETTSFALRDHEGPCHLVRWLARPQPPERSRVSL